MYINFRCTQSTWRPIGLAIAFLGKQIAFFQPLGVQIKSDCSLVLEKCATFNRSQSNSHCYTSMNIQRTKSGTILPLNLYFRHLKSLESTLSWKSVKLDKSIILNASTRYFQMVHIYSPHWLTTFDFVRINTIFLRN